MSRNVDAYQSAALSHFLGGAAMASDGVKPKQLERRRKTIKSASVAFHAVMTADDPPQTRDEAIRQAIGFLGMLFAAFFPQYSLAIRVAGFLWDVFHQGK